jgi:OFA family oxalate/formate antiporter-like MFS transporter
MSYARAIPWRERVAYPGWTMVFIAFVCVFFAFSAPVVTMPLIYGKVMQEFGWTRTQVTLIFTYKYMASSLVAMFVIGPLIERYGLRVAMVLSCLSTAIGMTSFLWIHSLWSYYLAGFLFGLGGTTLLIPIKLLVARWFNRNLGLAVGLAVIGTSVGGTVFPMLGNVLIERFGWRMAFASLSLGIWLVALPLYLWKARENPTEADVLPEAARGDAARAERLKAAELDTTFKAIVWSPMFWCISVGLFIVGAIDSGMLQHAILYLRGEIGLSGTAAAASLSGTFALGVLAKIVAGRVYDVYSIRGVQFWYFLLAVSIGTLFSVHSMVSLVICTVVRGIAHGGLISQIPVVAKHCYGPRFLSKVLAVFTGFFGFGAALGPLVLSAIYDHTHSYTDGFILFGVSCTAAAVLLQWVRPLYRDRMNAVL